MGPIKSPAFGESAIALVESNKVAKNILKVNSVQADVNTKYLMEGVDRMLVVKPQEIGYFEAQKISVFDHFLDKSLDEKFVTSQFRDLLIDLAPTRHCILARSTTSPRRAGTISCDYHSSEIGIDGDFWMRTTFAFSVTPSMHPEFLAVSYSLNSGFSPGPAQDDPERFVNLDQSAKDKLRAEALVRNMFVRLTEKSLE